MPVRSLNSAVLRWPDRETVLAAARAWAARLRTQDANIYAIYCVGSYARGDWGVGSDVDIIVLLEHSALPPHERYIHYYPDNLPVPADVWVYTRQEWQACAGHSPHLWNRIQAEHVPLARIVTGDRGPQRSDPHGARRRG